MAGRLLPEWLQNSKAGLTKSPQWQAMTQAAHAQIKTMLARNNVQYFSDLSDGERVLFMDQVEKSLADGEIYGDFVSEMGAHLSMNMAMSVESEFKKKNNEMSKVELILKHAAEGTVGVMARLPEDQQATLRLLLNHEFPNPLRFPAWKHFLSSPLKRAEYNEKRKKRLVDTISSVDVQITQNCETLLDQEFPELLVRGDTLMLMKTVLSYQHVSDTPSDPYDPNQSYLMIPIMMVFGEHAHETDVDLLVEAFAALMAAERPRVVHSSHPLFESTRTFVKDVQSGLELHHPSLLVHIQQLCAADGIGAAVEQSQQSQSQQQLQALRVILQDVAERLFIGTLSDAAALYVWDQALIAGFPRVVAPFCVCMLGIMKERLMTCEAAIQLQRAIKLQARTLTVKRLQRAAEQEFMPELRQRLGLPQPTDMSTIYGSAETLPKAGEERVLGLGVGAGGAGYMMGNVLEWGNTIQGAAHKREDAKIRQLWTALDTKQQGCVDVGHVFHIVPQLKFRPEKSTLIKTELVANPAPLNPAPPSGRGQNGRKEGEEEVMSLQIDPLGGAVYPRGRRLIDYGNFRRLVKLMLPPDPPARGIAPGFAAGDTIAGMQSTPIQTGFASVLANAADSVTMSDAARQQKRQEGEKAREKARQREKDLAEKGQAAVEAQEKVEKEVEEKRVRAEEKRKVISGTKSWACVGQAKRLQRPKVQISRQTRADAVRPMVCAGAPLIPAATTNPVKIAIPIDATTGNDEGPSLLEQLPARAAATVTRVSPMKDRRRSRVRSVPLALSAAGRFFLENSKATPLLRNRSIKEPGAGEDEPEDPTTEALALDAEVEIDAVAPAIYPLVDDADGIVARWMAEVTAYFPSMGPSELASEDQHEQICSKSRGTVAEQFRQQLLQHHPWLDTKLHTSGALQPEYWAPPGPRPAMRAMVKLGGSARRIYLPAVGREEDATERVRFELLRQGFPLTGLDKMAQTLQRFSESRWAGYNHVDAEEVGVGVVGGSTEVAASPEAAAAAAVRADGPIGGDNLFIDVVRDVVAAMRFLAKGPQGGNSITAAEAELLQAETEGMAQDTAAARRTIFGKKFENTTEVEAQSLPAKQRVAYEKKIPKYEKKLEKLSEARKKKVAKEIEKRRKQK
jgi:hypothetical protein